MLCDRSWVVPCESRWTHIGQTLRRWFVGQLGGRVLVESLKAVKVKFNLHISMEDSLAAIIAMDTNNFPVGNKLRLILKALPTGAECDWTVAIGIVADAPCEDLQYRLIGRSQIPPATLADMLSSQEL